MPGRTAARHGRKSLRDDAAGRLEGRPLPDRPDRHRRPYLPRQIAGPFLEERVHALRGVLEEQILRHGLPAIS